MVRVLRPLLIKMTNASVTGNIRRLCERERGREQGTWQLLMGNPLLKALVFYLTFTLNRSVQDSIPGFGRNKKTGPVLEEFKVYGGR